MKTKDKSLKLNTLLNMIRSLSSVIFPLITFPYISRVLSVDSVGRYNFATSVMSYISLIAVLGIEHYAIREGAKNREDREKFNDFANQMFTVNVISTLFSYLVLGALLLAVPKFYEYRALLLILGSQVLMNTLGVNWIYSIYEEFAYITFRSIIFQIVSIVAMFIFVREPQDVEIYAVITVLSAAGSNILNFFFSRRYCKLKLTLKIEWKKHFKPIMVLFGVVAAATVYAHTDTVILGFVSGEYSVGIYAVSMKMYTIVKALLASAVLVSIPRLSLLLGQKRREEADLVATDLYSTMLTLTLPAIVGLITLGRQIILLIAGDSYSSAHFPYVVLCVAIFFSLGSYFWGQASLVPSKREDVVLKATLVSAIVNLVLNFILIPFWHEKAAAITTLIAEIIGFVWNFAYGRKYLRVEGTLRMTVKIIVGCIPIPFVAFLIGLVTTNLIISTVFTIVISVILYAIIEILIKNEAVVGIYTGIKNKFAKKFNGAEKN